MTTDDLDAHIQSIAALGEPIRRALYQYVAGQNHPVGREQAASRVGVAHHVAKFHLDRLVGDGLLEVEYARPPGRGGPGAGRPAKLYRRAAHDISVTLPERRYDLAGRVMAEAISSAARDGVAIAAALREAASTIGRDLGAAAQVTSAITDSIDATSDVLARIGYEPRTADDTITLANCPFHSLAMSYTQLVCGMNFDLIGGLLQGLGCDDLCARLDPGTDRCCVAVARR